MAGLAHCCAVKLIQSEFFRHSNVPWRHCCAEEFAEFLKNCENFGKPSAQQFTADSCGAPAVHSTCATRVPAAHFAPSVRKCGAKRPSLTHRMCMKYTGRAMCTATALTGARAVYNVSARTGSQSTCSLHCMRAQRCTVHVQCTCIVNCRRTQQCTVHHQCTLLVDSTK